MRGNKLIIERHSHKPIYNGKPKVGVHFFKKNKNKTNNNNNKKKTVTSLIIVIGSVKIE